MQTKPLDFVTIFEPKTRRQSSLSVYGRQNKGFLQIVGNLEHNAQIEPATVADADKLIAWLEDWKASAKA